MSQLTLLSSFLRDTKELDAYLASEPAPVTVTGSTLSLPQILAVARYHTAPALSTDHHILANLAASRAVIEAKVASGLSVYGVSTGFGGSADTRTDDAVALGAALLQHQHAGVVVPTYAQTTSPPSPSPRPAPLPFTDPLTTTSMPESWVRAAILVRINSLIRGHSGVRPALLRKMALLLERAVTPLVPLRGSISASGDLSSLSYIAGTLIGNPAIRVWAPAPTAGPALAPPARTLLPASVALANAGIEPIALASKEHLGILNGTAFSAAVASLVVGEAAGLAVLAGVLTAMSVEALLGTRGSFEPFISESRPHPGQIATATLLHALLTPSLLASTSHTEVSITADAGVLRQDRYSLRTAPQWLGPTWEDIEAARRTVRVEVNSTTDNPLIQPPDATQPGTVHHGGNFQALALTNAMDHTRLALALMGKMMFVQLTEIINPATSRGLPPNLSGGEPSLDYGAKGIDIAAAAYVGELNGLGGMNVGVGSVSAEMHNQCVNSLALISARHTATALDAAALLAASHLYVLCQALDLRALQAEFAAALGGVVRGVVRGVFGVACAYSSMNDTEETMGVNDTGVMNGNVNGKTGVVIDADALTRTLVDALEKTSTMDSPERMVKVAAACTTQLVDLFCGETPAPALLARIPEFRRRLAEAMTELLVVLRCAYLGVARGDVRASSSPSSASSPSTTTGSTLAGLDAPLDFGAPLANLDLGAPLAQLAAYRGPAPAAPFLARTRPLYEFVRRGLGVGMHGAGNLRGDVFGMRGVDGRGCVGSGGAGVGVHEHGVNGVNGVNGELPGLNGMSGNGVNGVNGSGTGEMGPVENTIGDNIARIYEAIRDGRVARVVAGMVEEVGVGVGCEL
ncbi:phenylalanine ammonia-lyase [Leucogyrophana mollusca]|uniref:Phenylalanine ammonia-lyase n=1 Tax=Leucogyrophana mollusca TaxID=85980 RepID=A0ACB8BRE3_9AGAM|nr:phenylalanine ammonia-lyase [Leucogyrophana mollusca]